MKSQGAIGPVGKAWGGQRRAGDQFWRGVGWTLECHSSALPTGQARAIHPLCCLWKVSHLKFRLCGSPFSDEPGSRENGRHSRPALQDNLPQRMAWIWIEGAVAQVRGRRGPARVTVTPLTWSPLRSRLQAMWGDPRVCGGDATTCFGPLPCK
jgi:hypothetical protein